MTNPEPMRRQPLPRVLRGAARQLWTASIVGAALCGSAAWAETAAQYPSKPIRFVLPVTGGGTHDNIARAVGEKVSQMLGQPVVMDNKPGANGLLSTNFVAKAAPDGYTVLFSISNVVQNLILVKDPGYKLEDFTPLTQVAYYPTAFAINADIPAKTLPEFVALVKQKPGQYSFGSYGVGSGAHIIGEGLNKLAGIRMNHIPYKGETNSYTDLASGRLTANFGSAGFYRRQLTDGRVRVLAINNPSRAKTFPDIPTFGESGYEAINLPGWAGTFVPAATPADISAKLASALQRAVATPEVQKVILDAGMDPIGNTGAEFSRNLRRDLDTWGKLIKDLDFKMP